MKYDIKKTWERRMNYGILLVTHRYKRCFMDIYYTIRHL